MHLEWSPAQIKVNNFVVFFFVFSVNSFGDGAWLATTSACCTYTNYTNYTNDTNYTSYT